MAYCTGSDILSLALPIPALNSASGLRDSQVTAVCQAASDEFDGYARGRWGYTALPLLTWDTSVTMNVARRAAYLLMLLRGMKPETPEFKLLAEVNEEALKFFDDVQRQQRHPQVTLANANAPGGAQPILSSSSVVNLSSGATAKNRGW